MIFRKESIEKVPNIKPLTFLFMSLLFSSVLLIRPALAVELRGTVIAVKGDDVTIKVELMEPWSPTVGNMVDLMESADGGKLAFDIGDWKITEVNGDIVKAAVYNLTSDNRPKVNMKAVIRIPPGLVHAGEAPKDNSEKTSSPIAKGKVIMLKGKKVTIRLDEGEPRAAKGDMVEISFTVDGVVIPVGSWRVSKINGNGTVEAEQIDATGDPNINMDAQVFSTAPQKINVAEGKKKQPKSDLDTAKDDRSKYESVPKTIEEELALFSKTDVTKDFSALGKSITCYSGKVRIHPEKIEMIAKGGPKSDYCTLRLSDDSLTSFYAKLKVSIDITKHDDFRAGIIYSSQRDYKRKSDSIFAVISLMGNKVSTGFLKYRTDVVSWVEALRSFKKSKNNQIIFNTTLPLTNSNPTPGTMEFLKINQKCRIFWNGEEMGSWGEAVISKGQLWLAFSPVTKGKATAVFMDIQVYRLD